NLTSADFVAFIVAVISSVAFWWIYFSRAAADAADVIARSADPGRIGRSAYHLIHPIMVGGIIVAAAADAAVADLVADHGGNVRASAWIAWLILGGPALFLAGHAAFKAAIWRRTSWPRIAAIAVLALLSLLAPHVPAIALAGCSAAAVIAVAIADHFWRPESGASPSGASPSGASPSEAGPSGTGPSEASPPYLLGCARPSPVLGPALRFVIFLIPAGLSLGDAAADTRDDRSHHQSRRVPRHPPGDSRRSRRNDQR